MTYVDSSSLKTLKLKIYHNDKQSTIIQDCFYIVDLVLFLLLLVTVKKINKP